MGILSPKVLRPYLHQTKNPLDSAFSEIEAYLREKGYTDHLHTEWWEYKRKILFRVLHWSSEGSEIRSLCKRAPNYELETAYDEVYKLATQSVYYCSQFWRAFFYWLTHGSRFSPRWPLFGDREAALVVTLLTEEELRDLSEQARDMPLEVYDDRKNVEKIFRTIQPRIMAMCWKRLRYLSEYCPSMYAIDDLVQEANLSVMNALHLYDNTNKTPEEMIGLALTVASNKLHSIRDYANVDPRAPIKRVTVGNGVETHDTFTLREQSLYQPLPSDGDGGEGVLCLEDSLRSLGEMAFREQNEIYDNALLKELLSLSTNEGITLFLEMIYGGRHVPEFWEWYYAQYPQYDGQELDLEQVGGQIIVWLDREKHKMTKQQLVSFLHQHIPDVIERFPEYHKWIVQA